MLTTIDGGNDAVTRSRAYEIMPGIHYFITEHLAAAFEYRPTKWLAPTASSGEVSFMSAKTSYRVTDERFEGLDRTTVTIP